MILDFKFQETHIPVTAPGTKDDANADLQDEMLPAWKTTLPTCEFAPGLGL